MTNQEPHPGYPHLKTAIACSLSWWLHAIRQRLNTGNLLLHLIHWRLGQTLIRLDRLVLRWQTGALLKPGPSRAGQPRKPKPDWDSLPLEHRQRIGHGFAPDGVWPKVPTRYGWLSQWGGQPLCQYFPGVQHVLFQPDTMRLLQEVPQAVRLLRPLARLLCISHPLLDRPKRVRKPRPKVETKPQSRPRDARDVPGPLFVPKKWRLQIPKRSWSGGDTDWEKSG